MDRVEEILQFWFRGINDDTTLNSSNWPVKMWFMKDEKLDNEIRDNFEADIINGANNQYKNWEESARGRLALILLFDQFSRNIYRNTDQMFAFDGFALKLALKTIEEGKERDLCLIERVFLYLPLEHSEDIKMQNLSLERFQSLVDETSKINPVNAGYYGYTYDYALKHHEIIEQFGRFPHRNAILNRDSTKEEELFLKKPGSSF